MAQKTFKYQKDEVTVVWKPEQCIHSKVCWTELRSVFDPFIKPWVNMEGAPLDEIKAQVRKCPSGALSLLEDMEANAAAPAPADKPAALAEHVQIQIKPNGPILIQTSCAVTKPDGTVEMREGVTALCRCGASANKPYCDGAHKKIDFKD